VTITAVDDAIYEGDHPCSILLGDPASADVSYDALTDTDTADVLAAVTDNDFADVSISKTDGLTASIPGAAITYTIIVSNAGPSSAASITVSDTMPSSLTGINWTSVSTGGAVCPASGSGSTLNEVIDLPMSATCTFTVHATIDPAAVGTITNTVNASVGGSLPDLDPNNNTAIDTTELAGITVNPVSGLITTEAGGTAQFSIVLHTQPTADVTIGLTSSLPTEGSLGVTDVTFTAANWNTPQFVTVTGVDDAIADGNTAYTIDTGAAVSADSVYNGFNPADVSVTNSDDDSAGMVVTPAAFSLTEGLNGTYQIRLLTTPSIIPVTVLVEFPTEQLTVNGNNAPFFLTFNDTNPQTIPFSVLTTFDINTTRELTITHTVIGSTAPEYPIGMAQAVTLTILDFPPPPPTPLCEDHNFDEGGVVRSSTSDALGYAINCRVLYQNGRPTTWLGNDLYGEENLGVPGLTELGIQQAVDIFSPPGMTYFEGGAVFCVRGSGSLIWMAASGIPRHPEIIGSYTVPDFPGFTCATLFEPGTLILVRDNPIR